MTATPLPDVLLFGSTPGAPGQAHLVYKLIGYEKGGTYDIAVEAANSGASFAGRFTLADVVKYLYDELYVGVPESSLVQPTGELPSLLDQAFKWQVAESQLVKGQGLVLHGECVLDTGTRVKIRLPPEGALCAAPTPQHAGWILDDVMHSHLQAMREAVGVLAGCCEHQVSAKEQAGEVLKFVTGLQQEHPPLPVAPAQIATVGAKRKEPESEQQQQDGTQPAEALGSAVKQPRWQPAGAGAAAPSQASPQMSQQQTQQQSHSGAHRGRGGRRGGPPRGIKSRGREALKVVTVDKR